MLQKLPLRPPLSKDAFASLLVLLAALLLLLVSLLMLGRRPD
jgi:hypothetical protein